MWLAEQVVVQESRDRHTGIPGEHPEVDRGAMMSVTSSGAPCAIGDRAFVCVALRYL
jgi:hypothetical protein